MSTVVLVTGATSGVGLAFAQRLAGRCDDLIIVGRRKDRLEVFAAAYLEVAVRPLIADLSIDEGMIAFSGLAPGSVMPCRAAYSRGWPSR